MDMYFHPAEMLVTSQGAWELSSHCLLSLLVTEDSMFTDLKHRIGGNFDVMMKSQQLIIIWLYKNEFCSNKH